MKSVNSDYGNVDVKTQFESRRIEMGRRASFQHAYMLLNLVGSGAILAFAVTEVRVAALLVPYFSFILFTLWLHQATVISVIGRHIRTTFTDRWDSEEESAETPGERWMRPLTFAVAQGLNFIGVPLLAVAVYWQGERVGTDFARLNVAFAGVFTLITTLSFLWWLGGFYLGRFNR